MTREQIETLLAQWWRAQLSETPNGYTIESLTGYVSLIGESMARDMLDRRREWATYAAGALMSFDQSPDHRASIAAKAADAMLAEADKRFPAEPVKPKALDPSEKAP